MKICLSVGKMNGCLLVAGGGGMPGRNNLYGKPYAVLQTIVLTLLTGIKAGEMERGFQVGLKVSFN
jgi:hypothetical protein